MKMISKAYMQGQTGNQIQVTFTVPGTIWAERIELAIAWHDTLMIQPLIMTPTGDWTLTLDLAAEQVYRFHYLCDEQQWMGDINADGYELNPQDGSYICLLNTYPVNEPLTAPGVIAAEKASSPSHELIAVGGRR
jgi:hypothetical protein